MNLSLEKKQEEFSEIGISSFMSVIDTVIVVTSFLCELNVNWLSSLRLK